jgi:hypothetical protein
MVTSSSRDIAVSAAPEAGPRSVDFGLVIGIDHYSGAPKLSGAVADAVRFHAWLCAAEGGGLADGHARLVQSRSTPIAPLQKEVDRELHAIVTAAIDAGGGRRLYFHFSGHGAGNPESEDVALLLAKWSRSLARFALSTDEYRGELRRTGLFEEIVVSLDCCRTTAERAIGSPPTLALAPQPARCATRSFLAYATEDGRPAFEDEVGALWQGKFTRCLLASLGSSPHGIDASDLKRELDYTLRLEGQRPHVVNGLPEGSKFGGSGASGAPNLVITLTSPRAWVRLSDGRRQLVAQIGRSWWESPPTEPPPTEPPGTAPRIWELWIKPGLYKLEDDTGSARVFDHGTEAVTRVEL